MLFQRRRSANFSPRPSTISRALLAAFVGNMLAAGALGQSPQNPIKTEETPLPKGPPDVGMQAPLPSPIKALPPAEQPLLASPKLEDLKHYAASHPLTLADAVAIALYTNTDMAAAVAGLQRAQAATGIARSMLNPTIGVNSQLTYFGKETAFNTALLTGGTHGENFVVVPQYNPVITAAFTLPIDLVGTLRSAVSQAQFNEVASRIDVNRVRNTVIANVKSAFYAVLRNQAQVAVATDNVNVSLTRLSDANKNYAAGTSPYFDVLTSQRDLADAQQALIVAHGQVSSSLTNLKTIIGLDASSKVEISDEGAVEYPNGVNPPPPPLKDTSEPAQAPPGNEEEPKYAPNAGFTPLKVPSRHLVSDDFEFGPEFQAVLDEAMKTRPEILEGQARVTAADKGLLYAQRSDLPSLSLSLQYINTPHAAGFSLPNQEAAVLGINIPIFDGGLAQESLRDAKAVVAQAQVTRRQAEDQVQQDVQQAYIALVQARDRVAVTNAEVAQAQESFRLARVRYNAGMSNQVTSSPELELINAQTSLVQARTDQVNALYDYNNARAQLDRAIGRYSYMGVGPGYPTPPGDKTVGTSK
jgi:outer membrane protein TolC